MFLSGRRRQSDCDAIASALDRSQARIEFKPDGTVQDLSLSVTRAVSPIHIEYLKNMGVGASLSISIIIGGKLWGLFACHHYGPKLLPYSQRTAAELFSELFSKCCPSGRTDER